MRQSGSINDLIIEIPDRLSPDELKKTLQTRIIGKELLFFDEVNSTNEVAMQKGAKGLAEGLVVLSEGQTNGKGRLGRTWVSPENVNIYMSVLLRPDISPQHAPVMTMMSAISTARAITEINAEQERINYVVIGIGINVNMKREDFPVDLRVPATSLAECLGKRVDRMNLLLMLIRILEQDYDELKKDGIMSIFNRWRKGCDILNRRIKVSLPGEEITGVAEDLTPEGGLMVRLDCGEKRVIYAGDVSTF